MIDLLTVVAIKELSDSSFGSLSPPLRVNGQEMTVAQSSFAGVLVKEYGKRGKLREILCPRYVSLM